MTQLIILGWDALDVELIEQHDLSGRFGLHQTKIDTYVNPVINHPHTRELWPSMITGLHPDQHGIHAVTSDEGISWDSSVLNTASNLANGVVPQPLLDAIGRKLRSRGAGLDQKKREYYIDNGIDTVFDGAARPISIPNYQTSYDRLHGLDASRDNVWADLLVDRDGSEGFEPDISTSGVYEVLGREIGKRLGHTMSAINAGHNVVWAWFVSLDTVGHMAPAVGPALQQDYYEVAASVTQTIKQAAPDDAEVICLSDHGLQEGEHTHYATLCSDSPGPISEIQHVFDVADWVRRFGASASNHQQSIASEDMAGVQDQLEGLGYL